MLLIYWHAAQKAEAFEYLNSIKGKVHELLIEQQLVSSVPWITFVYDEQASYEMELNKLYGMIRHHQSQAEQKSQLSPTLSSSIDLNKSIGNQQFERYHDNQNWKLKKAGSMVYKSEDTYKYMKLRMPENMRLDVFNLDYEFFMNKVLQNMNRSRCNSFNMSTQSLHAVDEPSSPPLNHAIFGPSEMVDYNTEERVKSIKKFVELKKKDQGKMKLKLRRLMLEQENDRFEDFAQLKRSMEKSFESQFADLVEERYENNPDEDC